MKTKFHRRDAEIAEEDRDREVLNALGVLGAKRG